MRASWLRMATTIPAACKAWIRNDRKCRHVAAGRSRTAERRRGEGKVAWLITDGQRDRATDIGAETANSRWMIRGGSDTQRLPTGRTGRSRTPAKREPRSTRARCRTPAWPVSAAPLRRSRSPINQPNTNPAKDGASRDEDDRPRRPVFAEGW